MIRAHGRLFVVIAHIATVLAMAGVAQAQQQAPEGQPGPRRAILEQQMRERTGQLVKRRLGLNDAQMQRLQANSRQFEQQRGVLLTRERDVRGEMRQQIMAGEAASQDRVAALIDQVIQLERQRLDLLQSEQRELAKFLTPVQRAKLLGLQAELRRRTQELRGGRMPRPRGQGDRPPPRLNR